MSQTRLDEVNGWTPLVDALVARHGLVTAAVFGAIWRYCQMRDGVCRASYETLARRLGINRRTVIRRVQLLVAEGYLRALSPGQERRPRLLVDTGRVGELQRQAPAPPKGSAESRPPEASPPAARVTQSHLPPVRPGPLGAESHPAVSCSHQRVTGGPPASDSPSPVLATESHPKETLLRDIPREGSKNAAGPTEQAEKIWQQVFGCIALEMNRTDLQTWLQPARARDWDGRVLRVASANRYAQQWLDGRVKPFADRILRGVVGQAEAEVQFVVEWEE